MSTQATKKVKKQRLNKPGAPDKETLIRLYEYGMSPGKTQMKLVAKALVCSSFVGLRATSLMSISATANDDWLQMSDTNLLPISEAAVLSMMSDIESRGLVDWSESDLASLPDKVTKTLGLSKSVLAFLSQTSLELRDGNEFNLQRARSNLKKSLSIDTDEERYLDIYRRRVSSGLHDYHYLFSSLVEHLKNPSTSNSQVASAISNFQI